MSIYVAATDADGVDPSKSDCSAGTDQNPREGTFTTTTAAHNQNASDGKKSPPKQDPENPEGNDDEQDATKRRAAANRTGYKPTLRLLIATVSGFIVFVVAAVTLVVSTSVSTSTARKLGISLARALVTTAKTKSQDYFDKPVDHLDAAIKMFKKPGIIFPTDDPNMKPDLFCDILRPLLYAANSSYPTVGIVFDDKANFGVTTLLGEYQFVACYLTNFVAGVNSGRSVDSAVYYNLTTYQEIPHSQIPTNPSETNATTDSRTSSYYSIRPFVQRNYPTPMWVPSAAWRNAGGEVSLQLGIVGGIYNASSTFLGLLITSIPSEQLQSFFRTLDKTENSQVFAIDASMQVVATTAPTPAYNSWFQNVSVPVPPGCLTTNDIVPSTIYNPGIVCPRLATPGSNATYPYPPLTYAATNLKQLFSPKTETFVDATIAGTNYFVLSSPVVNRAVSFSLTIIFFMPEEDLLGDIVNGRNLSIIIAVAILVFAVLVVFAMIFLLLRPLNNILAKMSDATQLKLDEENESETALSSIAEVAMLQKAFGDMNVAVNSFVKYVPREVVRELIASGELCTIGMKPAHVVCLFSDLIGFTSVCERVPSDLLAKPLTTFFEKMTTIVDDHNLLVSAFIGDAIFAVASDSIPVACPNKEVKAALCALQMSRATCVDEVWDDFQEVGEQIGLRVGVNAGRVQCGNLGSSKRLTHTFIGNDINFAARCESFNKQVGTRVMFSETVASHVSEFLLLRSLMPVQVVGKNEAVMVYEAVGIIPGTIPERHLEKKESLDRQITKLHSLKHNNGEGSSQGSFQRQESLGSMDIQSGASNREDSNSYQEKDQNLAGVGAHQQHQQGTSSKPSEKKKAIRVNKDKAFITALHCLKRAMNHKKATLIATEFEVKFVTEYNSAVERFCGGDAIGCKEILQRVRKDFPVFFDSTAGFNMHTVLGNAEQVAEYAKRSPPSIITAEYSCSKLEKLCDKVKDSNLLSDFVFRAEEK